MTAKSAPYPPCTVTAYRLKYQDSARCLRRVTPTKLYRRAVSGDNSFSSNNMTTSAFLPACPDWFAARTVNSAPIDDCTPRKSSLLYFLRLQTVRRVASYLLSGDNFSLSFNLDNKTFLSRLAPVAHLAYCNSRFCLLKFTKPAHEHNLQGISNPVGKPAFLPGDNSQSLKLLPLNRRV